MCAALGAALSGTACDQELPTAVGGRLLPANAIRTYEVFLEPERYLAFDTAFGLYSLPSDADYVIVANSYGGSLNSRALLRYELPRTIIVIDAQGILRTDSMPHFIGGDVRLIVDTAASTRTDAALQLFRTTESWDRSSATWSLRVDTSGVRVPWTVRGGSPGALVSTTAYEAGRDTVLLPVDSATVVEWADTSQRATGVIVASSTADTRFRSALPVLLVRARSSIRPDTVVEMLVAPGRTFIFEPEPPDSAAAPRVGGTPAWRTIMRLRERLDTVTVACPGSASCRIRISAASITYAALQLQPVPAPAGFEPELPLELVANAVLPQTSVPLQRSPITEAVGGILSPVPVSSFRLAGAPVVELIMTELMRAAFASPIASEPIRPSHFALLQTGASRTFGFGTFAERPRLRLILSYSSQLELP